MSSYLILFIFLLVVLLSIKNKVNAFDSFYKGSKDGLNSTINMFSSLLTFTIALSFLKSSGIIEFIEQSLNFKYSFLIIQSMIRPLSASSSLSIMVDIYNKYGVDSVYSLYSTIIHYATDASLYLVPFYCGIYNIKKYNKALKYGIIINIFSYIIGVILISIFLI